MLEKPSAELQHHIALALFSIFGHHALIVPDKVKI